MQLVVSNFCQSDTVIIDVSVIESNGTESFNIDLKFSSNFEGTLLNFPGRILTMICLLFR